MSKEELENKIATYTGGRTAEEIVFGSMTTGASNDIEQATKIARTMITRYGMSKEFEWLQWKSRKINIREEIHHLIVLQRSSGLLMRRWLNL